MDLTFSPEDLDLFELSRKVGRQLRPESPPEDEIASDPIGWSRLADLGLLALGTPEERGKIAGGSWLQVCLVTQALAESACSQPYIGSGVLAPLLLSITGDNQARIAELASGSLRLGLALKEDLSVLANLSEDKSAIAFDVDGADSLLALSGEEPVRIVVVPIGKSIKSFDLTRSLCQLDLSQVEDAQILDSPVSAAELEAWNAYAVALTVADLVGAMQGSFVLALDHAKSRRQFGRHIGSFQVIQHMLADSFVSLETSKWIAIHAAWSLDQGPTNSFSRSPCREDLCRRTSYAGLRKDHPNLGWSWISLGELGSYLLEKSHPGVAAVWIDAIACSKGGLYKEVC